MNRKIKFHLQKARQILENASFDFDQEKYDKLDSELDPISSREIIAPDLKSHFDELIKFDRKFFRFAMENARKIQNDVGTNEYVEHKIYYIYKLYIDYELMIDLWHWAKDSRNFRLNKSGSGYIVGLGNKSIIHRNSDKKYALGVGYEVSYNDHEEKIEDDYTYLTIHVMKGAK